MGNYRYITNRTLQDKSGNEKGRIQVLVRNGSDKAEGKYQCPECDHKGTVDQEFKRPLSVRCKDCGFLMKLPKLKGKAK